MKKSHEIDQIALLKDIWQTFRHHFEEMLNDDFKQGVDPGGSGRLDVEIILNSLEWCKPVIAKHYECREEFLFARAEPLAGTTWETWSKEQFGWGMQEYLLDFSISHGAIEQAIGEAPVSDSWGNEKFALMLGAESEMGDNMDVTRDLLKLLDTKCRIKVLVYRARSYPAWIKTLKGQIEFVFNKHASEPTEDAWLVIGVPSYSQWVQFEKDRKKTPRQLYVLKKDGESYVLQDVGDWWQW